MVLCYARPRFTERDFSYQHMSYALDLDDTARFCTDVDVSRKHDGPTTEDTANLVEAFGCDTTRGWVPYDGVHPYAEGIIRFFRARTILARESDRQRNECAWHILEKLQPHKLPPVVRLLFLELVYFIQNQTPREKLESFEFCVRVLAIARKLDEFMDDIDGC